MGCNLARGSVGVISWSGGPWTGRAPGSVRGISRPRLPFANPKLALAVPLAGAPPAAAGSCPGLSPAEEHGKGNVPLDLR